MKANDYVAIYIVTEKHEGIEKAVSRIIKGLANDMIELMEKRKVQSNLGALAVFREVNEKYIAIARRLKKQKGELVLQEDGFKKIIISRIPELAEYI